MMQNKPLLAPNTTIDVILNECPKLAEIFNAHGMACVGCVFSRFHNLVDVAAAYKLDVDTLISELLPIYNIGTLPKADNA